jgi:hypothetical protein
VTATEAIPDSSGMQIVGDIGGNWKAIMHEQSNQYYYWNTITGETSWEIPNTLASVVSADGVTSASMPTHMEYSVEAHAHVLPIAMVKHIQMICLLEMTYELILLCEWYVKVGSLLTMLMLILELSLVMNR